jgi:hypothetical protein
METEMYEISATRAGQSDERQFMRAIALACVREREMLASLRRDDRRP